MNQYDNTNSGALFKNDKKTTPNHPDMRGSLNVGGVEYWVSCWTKTSKAGAKFMSLSVQPKEQERPASVATGGRNDPRPNVTEEFDDKIPW